MKTSISRLKAVMARPQARFLRREDGSVTIEAMLVLPMMFWAFLTMFAIYDAYRMHSVHQKVAFTISDAISRETRELDDSYLNGMRDLYEYLSLSPGQTKMRVSQLWYDADEDVYKRDWSQTRGGATALSNADVQNWHSKLPVMPHEDRIVVLETWSDYDPPFNTGLTLGEIRTFVFTRPRYAPRVCWLDCNPA